MITRPENPNHYPFITVVSQDSGVHSKVQAYPYQRYEVDNLRWVFSTKQLSLWFID